MLYRYYTCLVDIYLGVNGHTSSIGQPGLFDLYVMYDKVL